MKESQIVNNLIYDVGMNNGDDTKYYLSLGYNVIAIEASPDLVKEAQRIFEKAISAGKVKILNVGIASGKGILDFYLNKHDSVWNSFDKNIGTRGGSGYETIKVGTAGIDQIIKENGVPYYLKIDIEGCDKLCLESLKNCEEKPKFISLELDEADMIDKLKKLGYEKFKIIDQQNLLPLEIPATEEYATFKKLMKFKLSMNFFIRITRKLIGKFVIAYYEKRYKRIFQYNHPYGSSGTFGEHLPGSWLSYQDALKVYEFYKLAHQNSKTDLGYNFWLDIHASK